MKRDVLNSICHFCSWDTYENPLIESDRGWQAPWIPSVGCTASSDHRGKHFPCNEILGVSNLLLSDRTGAFNHPPVKHDSLPIGITWHSSTEWMYNSPHRFPGALTSCWQVSWLVLDFAQDILNNLYQEQSCEQVVNYCVFKNYSNLLFVLIFRDHGEQKQKRVILALFLP